MLYTRQRLRSIVILHKPTDNAVESSQKQRHPNLDGHHKRVIEQSEKIIGNSFEESDYWHSLSIRYVQKQQQIAELSIYEAKLTDQKSPKFQTF